MGLADARVGATVAVSDMERAKEFYEGNLDLSGGQDTGDGGHTYICGDGTEIHVFPSPGGAGASPSTVAGFGVEDIEATVEELSGKGVAFEQYGDPLNTDERGIADFGGEGKGAWFKDPDGNVLALIQS
jgi:predicted enzyme related to lactoylglutathione lyase